jgi:uncharacterized repeat protein (TIGR03803 family)
MNELHCGHLSAIAFVAAMTASNGASAHHFQLLHTFTGGSDGSRPFSAPMIDSSGALYGVTTQGGRETCRYGGAGCGTIFKIAPDGAYALLYVFKGTSDGSTPRGPLLEDSGGNLYGAASGGGKRRAGTVFEYVSPGTLKVLYNFTSGTDGGEPSSGVIADGAGNLYGATSAGGNLNYCVGNTLRGCGVLYKLTPNGEETVLHAFVPADGCTAFGPLLRDATGNLFGTTETCAGNGYGGVYRLSPDGKFKVLHSFSYGADGTWAMAGVIEDSRGYLYGTTNLGGAFDDGTVFRVAPDGNETVIYSFDDNAAVGGRPESPLLLGPQGQLFGETTVNEDSEEGTAFELFPNGRIKVLFTFDSASGGDIPAGGLIFGPDDYLYGNTEMGGSSNFGTVFSLAE